MLLIGKTAYRYIFQPQLEKVAICHALQLHRYSRPHACVSDVAFDKLGAY